MLARVPIILPGRQDDVHSRFSTMPPKRAKRIVIRDVESVQTTDRRGNLTFKTRAISSSPKKVASRPPTPSSQPSLKRPRISSPTEDSGPFVDPGASLDLSSSQKTFSKRKPKVIPQQSFNFNALIMVIFQTENDYLREWLPHRHDYLHELLEMESSYLACTKCGQSENLIRCLDCWTRPVWCKACCLDTHLYLPFHHIEMWTGRYFKAC